MPKPAHVRYTVSGIIHNGTRTLEQWSFSVSKPQVGDLSAIDWQLTADGLRAAYSTNLRPLYASGVRATEFRAARIGDDGKTQTDGSGGLIQGINTTEAAGTGSAAVSYPLQSALVVTLTTGRHGPTGKGRFFLPMPGYSLDSERLISVADATTVMDAARNFVVAVNALGPQKVAVVSSKGYSSEVTGFRVGRRPDVLRSRAGDVLEQYVSRTIGAS